MKKKPDALKWLLFALIIFGIILLIRQLFSPRLLVDNNMQPALPKPTESLKPIQKVYGVNISGGELGLKIYRE